MYMYIVMYLLDNLDTVSYVHTPGIISLLQNMYTRARGGYCAYCYTFFSQRYLALDDRIAWAHYEFPSDLFNGETVEEWVALNGKQGEGQEGNINIILTFTVRTVFIETRKYAYRVPIYHTYRATMHCE